MTAWMIYSVIVGAFVAGAAAFAERALATYRWPLRWVWAVALPVSVLLPIVSAWLPRGRDAGGVAATMPVGLVSTLAKGANEVVSWTPTATARLGVLDAPLIGLWIVGTALLLFVLVASHRRLLRESRSWPQELLAGTSVRVSDAIGPAVIGFFPGTIVVPRWVFALPEAYRRIIVLHEREHLRAHDQVTLLMALVAVSLMPWNPAIWWHFTRLRRAMELDCDARVLRSGVTLDTYAPMLVELRRYACKSWWAPIPALSEASSFLTRRIEYMTQTTGRRRLPRAILALAAAFILIVVACETETQMDVQEDFSYMAQQASGDDGLFQDNCVSCHTSSMDALTRIITWTDARDSVE